MTRRRRWIISSIAVLVLGILAVVLWPTGDPFAGVETVAIRSPDWGEEPKGEVIQGPFIDGLKVTLGEKNIAIVGSVDQADAVLAVKEIRLDRIELLIEGGRLKGRASATCLLKNLETGQEYLMDFYLTLEDDQLEARLVTRKFWQLWK